MCSPVVCPAHPQAKHVLHIPSPQTDPPSQHLPSTSPSFKHEVMSFACQSLNSQSSAVKVLWPTLRCLPPGWHPHLVMAPLPFEGQWWFFQCATPIERRAIWVGNLPSLNREIISFHSRWYFNPPMLGPVSFLLLLILGAYMLISRFWTFLSWEDILFLPHSHFFNLKCSLHSSLVFATGTELSRRRGI